ncbi:asparagine synthetase [Canna indica]|uniref:Asparagine synthetase n=1 Tax=Canna indica TaxID=4628 RepID=A0AAQ3K9C4_9LILI|nr:asparagine synthetase [Canna indica]
MEVQIGGGYTTRIIACFWTHQRLAIIYPAYGDQPLYNQDKSTIVKANENIYNHEQPRKSYPITNSKLIVIAMSLLTW